MPHISELPERVHTPGDIKPYMPEFYRERLDLRWASETAMLGGSSDPTIRLWYRFKAPTRMDHGQLVALLDAPPPPIFASMTTPSPAASVTTHMQIIADPASLPSGQPWFLYESKASYMGSGHSDIQGKLWCEDGTYVGAIVQHIADFSARKPAK